MQDLNQRVALITGASSGIGRATALAFARECTHVVAIARRADRLTELESLFHNLPGTHGDILTVVGNVQDAASMARAVDQAIQRFGRLDILVANAGVGHRGDLVSADWGDLERLLRTNIDGVLHSIRAAVPAMRSTGGGHIVIISSITAVMTMPYSAPYAASKAFVSSLARSLRLELAADHISVSDMLVGRTQTEFDQKRLGEGSRNRSGLPTMTAEQVAAAVLKATKHKRKTVVLRFFDRLIVTGSLLIPGIMARLAMRQYK